MISAGERFFAGSKSKIFNWEYAGNADRVWPRSSAIDDPKVFRPFSKFWGVAVDKFRGDGFINRGNQYFAVYIIKQEWDWGSAVLSPTQNFRPDPKRFHLIVMYSGLRSSYYKRFDKLQYAVDFARKHKFITNSVDFDYCL